MRVLAIDTSSKVLGVAVLDEDGGNVEFNYGLGLRHASHLVPTIKEVLKFAGLSLKDIDAYCVSIGPGSFTGLRIGVSTIKALGFANKKKVVAVPTLDALARNVPYTEDTICVIVDAKKERLYVRLYKYRYNRHCEAERSEAEAIPKKRDCFVGPSGLLAMTPVLLISYQELLSRLDRIKNGILLVGDGIPSLRGALDTKCQGQSNPFVGAIHELPLHRHFAPRNDVTIKFASEEFWYPRAINVARLGLQMLKKGKVVKDIDRLTPIYLHPLTPSLSPEGGEGRGEGV